MDSTYAGIIVAIVLIAVFFAITIVSWKYIDAQINIGYVVTVNNTEYIEVHSYDERGDAKIEQMIKEGYKLVGVSGTSSNTYTLTREESN